MPAASGLAAGFEIRFSGPITWWTTRNAGEITPHDHPMTLGVDFVTRVRSLRGLERASAKANH